MIIYRTILKELTKNLLIVVFSLSVLLFVQKFVMLSRLFMGKGADFVDIVRIFVYIQPSILLLALPMALLITIFLTFGRMATDSETIVFKASGMSFWDVSKATATISFACMSILLVISLYVLPRSMSMLKHTIHETIIKKASMTFEEGSFSDVFDGTVIYVKESDSKDKFRGIFIYKESDESIDKPIVIVAETGSVSSDPEKGLIRLSMNNGFIHTYKGIKSTETTFKTYDLVLTSGVESITKVKPEEVKTSLLWEGRKEKVQWEVEFHRRLALPLACMIFGLMGPALSSRIGKVGRLGGFSISLGILILYYIILIFAVGLAESGKVPAPLGGWTPDIIFSILAFFFFHLAQRDRPVRRL